jgi:NAD(P)-dependent dehydrogenase (short-subunit alcohol dehydrogenase family)
MDFSALRTYADTKLANLLTLPQWDSRWANQGITIDALHPGVLRTGLGDRRGPMGLLLKAVKRTWAPAEQGAAPVVRLALDDAGSGRWFVEDDEAPLEGAAADPDLARRVFAHAAELTSSIPGAVAPAAAVLR